MGGDTKKLGVWGAIKIWLNQGVSFRFGLQLDESTLPGNESLLLAYVRLINDGNLVEDLLFAKLLEIDTKGETVYRVLEKCLHDNDIPITNIIACATDGAPPMRGVIVVLSLT